MSATFESLQIQSRPGTTGNAGSVGTTTFTADQNGATVTAPAHMRRDSNIYHDRLMFQREILAASVDNAIVIIREGRWQLAFASYLPRVAGSGGAATVDIKVATGTQAPASGTTQLGAALDLVGTADTLQQAALIASPTVIGPGDRVVADLTGTLTSVVGCLTIELKRVG